MRRGFGTARARRNGTSALARGAVRAIGLAGTALVSAAPPAHAAIAPSVPSDALSIGTALGALAFAAYCGLALVRLRKTLAETSDAAQAAREEARRQSQRADVLAGALDGCLIAWNEAGEPAMTGMLSPASGVPHTCRHVLEVRGWLAPAAADLLADRIARLRRHGEIFSLTLTTVTGAPIAAEGRVIAGRPAVKLAEEKAAAARQGTDPSELEAQTLALRALVETLPHPIWVRDADGKIVWVNEAYARAVEAKSSADAARAGAELLDTDGRRQLAETRARGISARAKLAAVVAGERRVLDVVEVGAAHGAEGLGSGGIAVDVTELERIHGALTRTIDFHARTLDQLATAVAIFGADKRLTFYNAAFRALWGLDTAFLESQPEDGALLDQLRAERKLPEQANFRAWKTELQSAYRAVEAQEHWWHLPDGQTLRVIANPHPQGGVTYVYENVTERLDLESRYNSLIRVQGETLDHLAEGVAVFGSDGKLRLWNPAFATLWGFDGTTLGERPHVVDLITASTPLDPSGRAWGEIAGAATGLADSRSRVAGRIERSDTTVVDYATVPLPDGATLATFVNVTDTLKAERALMERNEALIEADRLKDAFIQHVSYELRSPLTTIIGFGQLLGDDRTGVLNDKQREYTDYILSSSSALLAIINDILDLATVDAGVMVLDLGPVDVARTIAAAAEGVQDRLREARLSLELKVPVDIGTFVGDEKRVRQVLFNLLSNAIAYSEVGGRIEIACTRDDDGVRIVVKDQGSGIPQDKLEQVFDRFVSDPAGQRRGAGLGLSIVKSFVELHGGHVRIDSKEGVGTTVICRFPNRPVDPSGDQRSDPGVARPGTAATLKQAGL